MNVLLSERATHYTFGAGELLVDAAMVGAWIFLMMRVFRWLDARGSGRKG